MKTKFLLMFVAVAILAMAIGQAQALTVDVPNGDFQTIHKPGEPANTATVPDGCYWSIPNFTIKGPPGSVATYLDGTTGDEVETPGWVIGAGSKDNADCMDGGGWGGPDGLGDIAAMSFASWGGPTYIETAAPLSLAADSYTLSADVYHSGGPVVLELIDAGGTVVAPDAESTPAMAAETWVEFTRSYNSIPAGDYKVLVGTRDDTGGGWTGNRASIDNVTLIPEPATMLLLGLGGLLIRRKK